MSAREQLQTLFEQLPDDQVEGALRMLGDLQASGTDDPVLQKLLDAPEDDEPLSDADREVIAQGRREIARGETISLERVIGRYE